jgi:hypothetical protein
MAIPLLQSPLLAGVRTLTFSGDHHIMEAIDILASSESIRGLEVLRFLGLGSYSWGHDVSERLPLLFASPYLTSLVELTIEITGHGGPTAQQIITSVARAPALASLRRLNLAWPGHSLNAETAQALVSSPHLAGLERLEIRARLARGVFDSLRQRFGDRLHVGNPDSRPPSTAALEPPWQPG